MKNGAASLDTYNYVRTDASALKEVIDVHDVFVKRNNVRIFFSYVGRLVLLANVSLLLIDKVLIHFYLPCYCISSGW
jgi:hypothetical protein